MSLGVALVTGAGRGIGRAIALRLAKDGYDIALNDLHSNVQHAEDAKADIARLGRRVCVIPANVKHEPEVISMVNYAADALGSLDILVANAGILHLTSILETSVEVWDEMLAVNSRGVFLCYKYAAKQMSVQGRGGRIIGACSILGKQGAELYGAYSASKFAIRGLTYSAVEHVYGSRVPDALHTARIQQIPLKRYGTAEEVAALVSFIASKDASYITGQSISINGDSFSD